MCCGYIFCIRKTRKTANSKLLSVENAEILIAKGEELIIEQPRHPLGVANDYLVDGRKANAPDAALMSGHDSGDFETPLSATPQTGSSVLRSRSNEAIVGGNRDAIDWFGVGAVGEPRRQRQRLGGGAAADAARWRNR